jgi:hypothetical protein
MPIIGVRGPKRTGPARSRRSASTEPTVQQAAPLATVVDPSSHRIHLQGAPSLRPTSSTPMFLLRQHILARAQVLQAVVTWILLVIESYPRADLQGMDFISLTLYIQAHALHHPEEMI